MPQTYEGRCHCGPVLFRVRGDPANASECNQSVYIMDCILHLFVPRKQFDLLSGKDAITTYLFGARTPRHAFCRYCGIHSFYAPRSAPADISVNSRCLEGVDIAAVRPRPFDGQHREEAMHRRREAEAT